MAISQISVFVENRPGRLADITAVLAKNSIDIRALSVAEPRTTAFSALSSTTPSRRLRRSEARE